VSGGFSCCLRDFGRFAWMIAIGGVVDGRQIVPAAWLDACRSPTTEMYRAFAGSEYAEAFPDIAYHNKSWVRPGGHTFMALGIYGQTMSVNPVCSLKNSI